MLNSNQSLVKNNFSQVAMIQSQYESKKKGMLSITSLLSNKSPLRDRQNQCNQYQNQNNMNTPSRMQGKNVRSPIRNNNSHAISDNGNNTGKVSLSPLRSRRNNQSIGSVKPNAISRRKLTEPVCDQHKNKQADFQLESEGQYFYFCQTCAIPLIVQGFPCTKLNSHQQVQPENPRIQEVDQFLKNAEQVSTFLLSKKTKLNKVFDNYNKMLEIQKNKISSYYAQIHQLINEHMSHVIDQLEAEFIKSTKKHHEHESQVDEATINLKEMKDDITTSMNSVVVEASESDYRSVMQQYYNNLDEWKKLSVSEQAHDLSEGTIRKLVFGEVDSVLEGVTEVLSRELVVEWDDEVGQSSYQDSETNKAFNSKMQPNNQLESQRQNPIECLQTQERNKSNLKDLGGLFCSFDD